MRANKYLNAKKKHLFDSKSDRILATLSKLRQPKQKGAGENKTTRGIKFHHKRNGTMHHNVRVATKSG